MGSVVRVKVKVKVKVKVEPISLAADGSLAGTALSAATSRRPPSPSPSLTSPMTIRVA